MNAPFFWGNNGQQLTPGQVKVLRELAASKANGPTPTNLGEGLASVGDALVYNSNMARAGEAESAGIAQVQQALAEARASGSSDSFLDVMGNEWATPGQQLIAGELYKQSQPDWQTFEQGGDHFRYNANADDWTPEQFYDAPEDAALEDENFFGNVVPMQDEDGNLVLGQASNKGRWQPMQGTDGLTPAPTTKQVDTGTEIITQDIYGNELFRTPKQNRQEAADKAGGTEEGRTIAERELQRPAAIAAAAQADAKVDTVIQTINEALDLTNAGETGLFGSVMGAVPGTKAFDLREKLKTVKANLGFAELQAMRDASPTGGALGQVAVQELESLQATLASLNADQSEAQLEAGLARVAEILERNKQFRQMSLEAKFATPQAAPGGEWTVLGVE